MAIAAHAPHGVGVVGRRHEDAGHDLLGSPPPASCTMGATVATSSADSQLMMAPSPSRPARRSMPSRSAATRIGTGSGGTTPSLKPLTENVSYSWVTFSPASAWRRKRTMSRVRWYGWSKGMPFQPSTMTLDDVPMPSANPPRGGLGQRADALGEAAGPPGEGGDDGGAEPQRRRPHRGQRQRREGVGAVGLGRPHVRVAEVGQLDDPVTLRVERGAVERDGHAVALHDRMLSHRPLRRSPAPGCPPWPRGP